MEKISIDQYPKDTAPVVLLWGEGWANPIMGKWNFDVFDQVWITGEFIGERVSLEEFEYIYPTHFTYLQEER